MSAHVHDAAMTEIVVDTIGKLGANFMIVAFCNSCRRDAELSPDRLVALYGAGLRLDALRNRLTCRKCRARSRELRIVYGVPAIPETYGSTP